MTRGSKRFLQNEGKIQKDIPYSDSYLDVAWMLEEIKVGGLENYLLATLLDWRKRGYLKLKSTGSRSEIIFLEKRFPLVREYENELHTFLRHAAKSAKSLSLERLERAADHSPSSLKKIEEELRKESLDRLEQRSYIHTTKQRVLLYKKERVVRGTEKGEVLYDRLVQFENALAKKDFPTFNELTTEEWHDYLIWASCYGLEDEVKKHLESVMPKEAHTSFNYLNQMKFYHRFAQLAKQVADEQ